MRAGRLFALLRLLEDGRRWTAGRLAHELEVSERTILRDLDELSGAGVPVVARPGRGGGVELLGPSTLPWSPGTDRVVHDDDLLLVLRLTPGALARARGGGALKRVRRRSSSRSPPVEVTARVESDRAIAALLAAGPGVEVVRPVVVRSELRAAAIAIAEANHP